jgi:hypothetical protein
VPRFVFDRGFMGLELVQLFAQYQAIFYVRLKAGRLVALDDTRVQVRELEKTDTHVTVAGTTLRVIRSDQPEEGGEPWYILTSDLASRRSKILQIYCHRFEIEETFKDLKHTLGLVRTHFMKPVTLEVLLWFCGLSFILAYLSGIRNEPMRPTHPKKQLSWHRQFFEAMQREFYAPITNLITGGL